MTTDATTNSIERQNLRAPRPKNGKNTRRNSRIQIVRCIPPHAEEKVSQQTAVGGVQSEEHAAQPRSDLPARCSVLRPPFSAHHARRSLLFEFVLYIRRAPLRHKDYGNEIGDVPPQAVVGLVQGEDRATHVPRDPRFRLA